MTRIWHFALSTWPWRFVTLSLLSLGSSGFVTHGPRPYNLRRMQFAASTVSDAAVSGLSMTSSALDLHLRTLETLDYPIILNELADLCGTVTGKRVAASLELASSLEDAVRQYDMVREVSSLPSLPPIDSALDIGPEMRDIENG